MNDTKKQEKPYTISGVVLTSKAESLHETLANCHPSIARGKVWCRTCGDSLPLVSECTTRDWIITYADSDGTIQKAVVSGKNDDEALANFQEDYYQQWRTIKAIV